MPDDSFNTQPPEGGWLPECLTFNMDCEFQHTAARRRLDLLFRPSNQAKSFNTQPPEGGWSSERLRKGLKCCFNTQPPEGGWLPNTNSQSQRN